MHRIIQQARFAKEVSDRLQEAADNGQILEDDAYLTSDDAAALYGMCDDGASVETALVEMMEPRLDRFIAAKARELGRGPERVPVYGSDEFHGIMRDAGR